MPICSCLLFFSKCGCLLLVCIHLLGLFGSSLLQISQVRKTPLQFIQLEICPHNSLSTCLIPCSTLLYTWAHLHIVFSPFWVYRPCLRPLFIPNQFPLLVLPLRTHARLATVAFRCRRRRRPARRALPAIACPPTGRRPASFEAYAWFGSSVLYFYFFYDL